MQGNMKWRTVGIACQSVKWFPDGCSHVADVAINQSPVKKTSHWFSVIHPQLHRTSTVERFKSCLQEVKWNHGRFLVLISTVLSEYQVNWVKVLCLTRHIIGHFRDVLPSQSLGRIPIWSVLHALMSCFFSGTVNLKPRTVDISSV